MSVSIVLIEWTNEHTRTQREREAEKTLQTTATSKNLTRSYLDDDLSSRCQLKVHFRLMLFFLLFFIHLFRNDLGFFVGSLVSILAKWCQKSSKTRTIYSTRMRVPIKFNDFNFLIMDFLRGKIHSIFLGTHTYRASFIRLWFVLFYNLHLVFRLSHLVAVNNFLAEYNRCVDSTLLNRIKFNHIFLV